MNGILMKTAGDIASCFLFYCSAKLIGMVEVDGWRRVGCGPWYLSFSIFVCFVTNLAIKQ